jgi:dienelactone hydrolase
MSSILVLLAFLLAFAASGCVRVASELPDQYREPFAKSWPIRERQHVQMKAYLDAFAAREREESDVEFKLDLSSVEAYERSLETVREQMKKMAGWPPPKAVENPTPRFELVARDKAADIYRVWTEVYEGVEAYAIYMVPRGLKGKAPVIIAVHGGSGCPEAICDLDTRVNYHSFGHEAAKRGYIVYAPGILMAVSYAEPPDPTPEGLSYRDLGNQAREIGTDLRALQVYQIIEGAKAVIEARPEADGDRIGMTGLSMGAGYTLSTAPLWTDIKAAVPSAGLTQRRPDEPGEQQDLTTLRIGARRGRTAMGALICPRPLMIQSGKADGVVPYEGAKRTVPKIRAYYEKLGIADRFEFNVHDGGHVFENEAIFRFFDKHLR